MAINRRVLEKIQERAEGNESLLQFLIELLRFEAEGSGRYTKEYEELLRRYVGKED